MLAGQAWASLRWGIRRMRRTRPAGIGVVACSGGAEACTRSDCHCGRRHTHRYRQGDAAHDGCRGNRRTRVRQCEDTSRSERIARRSRCERPATASDHRANNVIRSGILKPWRMYRSDTQSQRFIYWPSDWRTGSYSRSHGHDSHAILALAFDGDQGSGPRGRNDLLSQAPALYGRHLYTCAAVSKSLQTNRAMPHDLSARLDSQLAVWLATTGLGRVDWGASHGIGHQLGAVANVPHGHCSCVMLPSVLRWNHSVNAAQQAVVAQAMGAKDEVAAIAVAKLVETLGQPAMLV
jgi:hypothetical protein